MALLLNANDSVSRSYSITKPSPLHLIVPSECGERTENLFDIASTSESGYIDDDGILTPSATVTTYDYIDITGNTEVSYKAFTLTSGERGTIRIAYYDENKSFLSRYVKTNMALQWTTVTLPSGCVYVRFSLDNNLSDTMLTEGSTPPTSYEPYGYKLPLLSGSTPVDIYLGESQTTRRIKKLVFDGTEDWQLQSNRTQTFKLTISYAAAINCISSHYMPIYSQSFDVKSGIYARSGTLCIICDMNCQNLTDFKAFLAQQYANGTPVTVWYVLATPSTGILNEPLRKIGDYADTIDNTQTTVQIPTSANSTTISWAGSGLAPSEFDSIAEWVSAMPKIYTNGAWTDAQTYVYDDGAWVADN